MDARTLYVQVYCARGEMENRIKERQLDPFAGPRPRSSRRVDVLQEALNQLLQGL